MRIINHKKIMITMFFLNAGVLSAADGVMPDYMKMQYAGNVGFISGGPGYCFFKDKLQFDMSYGYIPAAAGGTTIHTFTSRVQVVPVSITLTSNYEWYPLTISGFASYTPGNKYVLKWPGKYPDNYYKPTAVYTGESIGFRLHSHSGFVFDGPVDYYAEVGTLSVYAMEYYNSNGYLSLKDIVNLSFGVMIYL